MGKPTKRRKSDGIQFNIGKRIKVQAQRKFAQGATILPLQVTKDVSPIPVCNDGYKNQIKKTDFLMQNIPKVYTEDFLTYLCFKGSPSLSSHLRSPSFLPGQNVYTEPEYENPVKQPTTVQGPVQTIQGFIPYGVRKQASQFPKKVTSKKTFSQIEINKQKLKYREIVEKKGEIIKNTKKKILTRAAGKTTIIATIPKKKQTLLCSNNYSILTRRQNYQNILRTGVSITGSSQLCKSVTLRNRIIRMSKEHIPKRIKPNGIQKNVHEIVSDSLSKSNTEKNTTKKNVAIPSSRHIISTRIQRSKTTTSFMMTRMKSSIKNLENKSNKRPAQSHIIRKVLIKKLPVKKVVLKTEASVKSKNPVQNLKQNGIGMNKPEFSSDDDEPLYKKLTKSEEQNASNASLTESTNKKQPPNVHITRSKFKEISENKIKRLVNRNVKLPFKTIVDTSTGIRRITRQKIPNSKFCSSILPPKQTRSVAKNLNIKSEKQLKNLPVRCNQQNKIATKENNVIKKTKVLTKNVIESNVQNTPEKPKKEDNTGDEIIKTNLSVVLVNAPLVNELLKPTTLKLEKSFSESDDEPLALKMAEGNEKVCEISVEIKKKSKKDIDAGSNVKLINKVTNVQTKEKANKSNNKNNNKYDTLNDISPIPSYEESLKIFGIAHKNENEDASVKNKMKLKKNFPKEIDTYEKKSDFRHETVIDNEIKSRQSRKFMKSNEYIEQWLKNSARPFANRSVTNSPSPIGFYKGLKSGANIDFDQENEDDLSQKSIFYKNNQSDEFSKNENNFSNKSNLQNNETKINEQPFDNSLKIKIDQCDSIMMPKISEHINTVPDESLNVYEFDSESEIIISPPKRIKTKDIKNDKSTSIFMSSKSTTNIFDDNLHQSKNFNLNKEIVSTSNNYDSLRKINADTSRTLGNIISDAIIVSIDTNDEIRGISEQPTMEFINGSEKTIHKIHSSEKMLHSVEINTEFLDDKHKNYDNFGSINVDNIVKSQQIFNSNIETNTSYYADKSIQKSENFVSKDKSSIKDLLAKYIRDGSEKLSNQYCLLHTKESFESMDPNQVSRNTDPILPTSLPEGLINSEYEILKTTQEYMGYKKNNAYDFNYIIFEGEQPQFVSHSIINTEYAKFNRVNGKELPLGNQAVMGQTVNSENFELQRDIQTNLNQESNFMDGSNSIPQMRVHEYDNMLIKTDGIIIDSSVKLSSNNFVDTHLYSQNKNINSDTLITNSKSCNTTSTKQTSITSNQLENGFNQFSKNHASSQWNINKNDSSMEYGHHYVPQLENQDTRHMQNVDSLERKMYTNFVNVQEKTLVQTSNSEGYSSNILNYTPTYIRTFSNVFPPLYVSGVNIPISEKSTNSNESHLYTVDIEGSYNNMIPYQNSGIPIISNQMTFKNMNNFDSDSTKKSEFSGSVNNITYSSNNAEIMNNSQQNENKHNELRSTNKSSNLKNSSDSAPVSFLAPLSIFTMNSNTNKDVILSNANKDVENNKNNTLSANNSNTLKSKESEDHLFYIPLQGVSKSGMDMSNRFIEVKMDTRGPGEPQQRGIMTANLVRKSELKKDVKSSPKQVGSLIDMVKNVRKAFPESTIHSENVFQSKSTVLPQNTNIDTTVVKEQKNQKCRTQNFPVIVPQKASSKSSTCSSQSSCSVPRKTASKTSNETINPINSTAFPEIEDSAQIVEAPIFQPTEKQFQDPLEFIEKISPIAAKYGLCKIIPPASFKSEYKISDDMRFTPFNQYLHRMLYRWGSSSREMCAIKKYLATQSVTFKQPPSLSGIEVDLPKLYHIVQNMGGLNKVLERKMWHKVAEEMCLPPNVSLDVRLDEIYCKYLLPYDTLSSDERKKLFESVDREWEKRQKRMMSRALNPLNLSSNETDDSEHDITEDIEECITRGRSTTLSSFIRTAKNTMTMQFGKVQQPTPEEVETKFWEYVQFRNKHVCVSTGSIDSSVWGYGFPNAKTKNSSIAKHPWNLKVLTNNCGSILRSLGPIMGVTVPTIHVGMLFSTCCWYRDPHGLPWIEYLHDGASKIWYGVPDSQSAKFKNTLTSIVPSYCQKKTIWLLSDTTMVPPTLLTDHGVSLCRTIQHPGEFILVFPKAFTSSLCTGYNVSESVYFAQSSWLDTAQQDFIDIRNSCEPSMFSLERLIVAISEDIRTPYHVLKKVLPALNKIIQMEKQHREVLFNIGLKVLERTQNVFIGRRKVAKHQEEMEECHKCRSSLSLSMLHNDSDGSVFCLIHAAEYLAANQSLIDKCKLIYMHSIEELERLLSKLIERINSLANKKCSKYK